MKKKTTKYFNEEIKKLVGNEYSIIGDYKGAREKIRVKHIKCGLVYEVLPYNLLRGQKCPICARKNTVSRLRKKPLSAKKEVEKLTDSYELAIETFQGYHSIVKIKHLTCGNYETVRYSNFINRGGYCIHCSRADRLNDLNDIKNRVFNLKNNKYSVLSNKYDGMTQNMKFIHNVCGYKFEMKPINFFRAKIPCAKCRKSKGEDMIKSVLEKYEINFIEAYKIIENEKKLFFDFAILDKLNNISLIIEYHGKLNYGEIAMFNMNIKEVYCKKNNIYLSQISYKAKGDIETVLLNILKDSKIL